MGKLTKAYDVFAFIYKTLTSVSTRNIRATGSGTLKQAETGEKLGDKYNVVSRYYRERNQNMM